VVVTKLDRLARSILHLWEIVQGLDGKGVALRILNLVGKRLIHVERLAGWSSTSLPPLPQFEREMMLERQREGIAKAKVAGKYKGRKPIARAKADDAVHLFRHGQRVSEIAKALGIGRGSVYRALDDAGVGAA
jgi:DNA invertase Pin-like site-specific DNA recombinase